MVRVRAALPKASISANALFQSLRGCSAEANLVNLFNLFCRVEGVDFSWVALDTFSVLLEGGSGPCSV